MQVVETNIRRSASYLQSHYWWSCAIYVRPYIPRRYYYYFETRSIHNIYKVSDNSWHIRCAQVEPEFYKSRSDTQSSLLSNITCPIYIFALVKAESTLLVDSHFVENENNQFQARSDFAKVDTKGSKLYLVMNWAASDTIGSWLGGL